MFKKILYSHSDMTHIHKYIHDFMCILSGFMYRIDFYFLIAVS